MALPLDLQRLLAEAVAGLDAALRPLARAVRDPLALHRLLHQVGWDLEALVGADPVELADGFDRLSSLFELALRGPQQAASTEDLGPRLDQAVTDVRALTQQVDGLLGAALLAAGQPTEHHQHLVAQLSLDIADHLLLRSLAGRAPLALGLARLVGLVAPRHLPPLYASATPAQDDLPVRYPTTRLGVNLRGLGDALLVPVGVVLDNLPAEAFRSPAAFLTAVERTLGEQLVALLRLLRRRRIAALTVSLDGKGVEAQAPGALPRLLGAEQVDALEIPLGASGRLRHLTLGVDHWRVDWSAASASEEVAFLDGTLVLGGRFDGGTEVGQPGVQLALDLADPARPAGTVSLAAAFRLVVADGVEHDLGVRVTVDSDAAGAFSVAATAEVAGQLVLPVALPGLDGLAFVVDAPMARVALHADADAEPALTVSVHAAAFELGLPSALARRAVRGSDGRWQLQDSPRLRFSLANAGPSAGPSPTPLVEVQLGRPADGAGVQLTDLTLRAPAAGDSLVVDPDGAIFIGLDSPDQGFVLEIDPFAWDFTAGDTLAGGLRIPSARVHLPAAIDVVDTITIADATLDETGFSGSVSALLDETAAPRPLFGVLPIQLHSIHLELRHNLPTAFDLRAAVQLPYFDEWVEVTIGIDDAFNAVVTVSSTDPAGITLAREELLALTFRSAGLEHLAEPQRLRLSMSGGIQPLLWGADGLEWPRLDVSGLVLEQDLAALADGRVEPPVVKFEEAWLDLKELATLDLFGFAFELERIGIGYEEPTDRLWVDLAGSLRLIDLVPVGVGVEGFRITWPRRIYEELGIGGGALTVDQVLAVAGRIEVRFDGVHLFFGVPETVEFEGVIRFIKEAQKVGFAGDVALRVPPSGLAVEAGLMVGMNFADPPYPFLYVYFGVLLPAGIPLGQSGLALKGAKGLFGLNVEPDRSPEQNPYYDWYQRGPIEGAHPTSKWRDRNWSVAFGAGVTITTVDGKLLGVQGLLALVLPGPIVFVEGKALVFDGVFPGDGPLKALGYFDGNELTAQFNIEAALELVQGVVDVNAGLEAFFDFRDLHNWHLHLGKDEPMERRVRASLLQLPAVGWLFQADSYLMLDMADEDTLRSRLGVHIGFEPPAVDLVVASATVRAVLDGTGLLTLNPLQLNGELSLDAVVDVEAFGLTVAGVVASARVAVEGALPLLVDAVVAARVDLPVPDFDAVPAVGEWAASALDWFEEEVADLPDIPEHIHVEVPLHWELDGPPVIDPLVRDVTVESWFTPGGGSAPAADGRGDPAALDAPVVPLDARPTVLFDQHVNVHDGLPFGGFSAGKVERFRSGKLAFRPALRDVRIWRLARHRFDPSLADQPWELVARAGVAEPALWGAFRPGDGGGAGRRVLDLWTANVFEFLTGTIPLAVPSDDVSRAVEPTSLADGLLAGRRLAWCAPAEAGRSCIDREDLREAARGRPVHVSVGGRYQHRLTIRGVTFQGDDLRITHAPALRADAGSRDGLKLVMSFPEPVVAVTLVLAGDKQAPLRAAARRGEPVVLGKADRAAPRLGRGCAVSVPATVAEHDGVVEVTTAEWFDCLRLTSDTPVELGEVCWVTADGAEAAAVSVAECERNLALAGRAGDIPVVLSAGSYYKIEVDSSIELDESASDWSTLALCRSIPAFGEAVEAYRAPTGPLRVTDTRYFQTAGPPQDLRPYVQWVSPRHGSTTHWHGDDFVVRFNRSYLHRLYPDGDNSLGAGALPYALEAIVRSRDGHVIRGFFANWTTSESATLLPDERRLLAHVAQSPQPLPAPPPDDVLEIRHHLLVRQGTDLGVHDWEVVALDASPGRPKWRRRPDGSVHVAAPGNAAGSLFLTGDGGWTDYHLELDVEVDAFTHGEVGAVFCYASAADHYALRIRAGRPATAEIVRRRAGQEAVLAAAELPGEPSRLAVRTRQRAGGLEIQARVDATRLEVLDAAPATGGGRLGFLARDADARFAGLTVSRSAQELAPGTRYTLLLTGGEGGRTILRDSFSAPQLGDHWLAEPTSWTTGDGLRAAAQGASLAYADSLDDVELLTTLELSAGDAVRLRLRTPDGGRAPANTTSYELVVGRTADACELTAHARAGSSGVARHLGSGRVEVAAAPRLPVRVRLVGDLLRVWVFEWLLVDVELHAVDLPPAWSGRFEWTVTAGEPVIRAVELRDPSLLSVDFTTSAYRSFTELLAATIVGADRTAAETYQFADFTAEVEALSATQRTVADARSTLLGTEARFAAKRTDRAQLEHAKQHAVRAAADHDERFFDLLVRFDAAAHPALTAPTVQRLAGAGEFAFGFLLRSPVPLDPVLVALQDSEPFGAVGRTSFELLIGDGDAVPTGWIASADGTALVLYQRAGAVAQEPDRLRAQFVRHYHDDRLDDAELDHLYDRPYLLARSSSDPETVVLSLVVNEQPVALLG